MRIPCLKQNKMYVSHRKFQDGHNWDISAILKNPADKHRLFLVNKYKYVLISIWDVIVNKWSLSYEKCRPYLDRLYTMHGWFLNFDTKQEPTGFAEC